MKTTFLSVWLIPASWCEERLGRSTLEATTELTTTALTTIWPELKWAYFLWNGELFAVLTGISVGVCFPLSKKSSDTKKSNWHTWHTNLFNSAALSGSVASNISEKSAKLEKCKTCPTIYIRTAAHVITGISFQPKRNLTTEYSKTAWFCLQQGQDGNSFITKSYALSSGLVR